jgi:hypothetical protein
MKPGWYPDPDDENARRYWDGESWSAPLLRDLPPTDGPRPADGLQLGVTSLSSPPGSKFYPTFDTPQWDDDRRFRRRLPIIGPLIMVAGVIVGVVFAFFIHVSADVPIFGEQGCGNRTALDLTLTPHDDVLLAFQQEVGDNPDAEKIGENFLNDCYDNAHQDLWIAGAALVGGLLLGGFVSARETGN